MMGETKQLRQLFAIPKPAQRPLLKRKQAETQGSGVTLTTEKLMAKVLRKIDRTQLLAIA